MARTNGKGDNLSGWDRLEIAWCSVFSNLHGATGNDSDSGVFRVTISAKAGGVWTAAAKRIAPGTQAGEIAFGSGGSLLKALRELNGSIAAGSWKVDRPWAPNGADRSSPSPRVG